MTVQIFATERRTGVREEITDLYWFEESGIRSFSDPDYTFEVLIDGRPLENPTGPLFGPEQVRRG